ncbi:MAG: ribosome-associated translation inhibitor RaiA [Pseudomonadales bacterium]|jgi:putative sigma-54 modulation protein|nr:ribosome-associated translation inhibitor RaiA [Pseudomonadales bacterium]MCC6530686.1 ribosome-associated translation inhibitor RaiA [Pseudomonadales bacterium]MCP5332882.1 ribosome-associated translation inhibitor RaiA [Pseudomonadales bacterium]HMU89550.1 ribosome-associated translation inhibitor RaiA [Pseudomonadales bacterium]HMW14696.1 ribosome-associated translation inhibitor RaiA [Pseudomonadales bacterium]
MQINVSGHHVEVSPALHDYVTSKMNRIERHFEQITSIDVILSVEKQRQKAEATIRFSGGEIFADIESDDMYAAIDAMADKLDRQMIKHKEKSIGRHHGGSNR